MPRPIWTGNRLNLLSHSPKLHNSLYSTNVESPVSCFVKKPRWVLLQTIVSCHNSRFLFSLWSGKRRYTHALIGNMEQQQQWGSRGVKHRHDGTSPLPLAMDWSLPPSTWNGRDTIWPNDSRTGWSYCVTIPTWVVVPKARDTGASAFYRVQVGLQSPEGVTTTHTVLRNFNDFLSLVADLRKAFPKKNFPPTPPKQVTRNWAVMDKRRRTLEDWMTRLLYDIDKSRSMAVASFFELEAAARSSFQDENPQTVEGNISKTGSENLSLDKDLTNSLKKLPEHGVSNTGKGLYTGPAKLKQVEEYSGDTSHAREIYKATTVSVQSGKSIIDSEKLLNGSFRKPSSDDGLILQGEEASSDKRLSLPFDEQQKVNEVFMSMQRNVRTAKLDMEDLIFRFSQEVAEKNYLTTKVKDLQEELETTKQRSKENLQQAILVERERVTQMQRDMDKLERKSLEMEFKLQPQQFDKTETESPNISVIQEKDEFLQELDTTKNKLNDLLKKHRELETNSKEDIKVLVQEVKSLRSSQANLKQQLKHSLERKTDTEKLLQQEKQKSEKEKAHRLKLIHEFEALHHRLRECSMNMLNETQDKAFHDSSSVKAASKILQISDDQIEALLAEAHNLSQNDNHEVSDISQTEDGGTTSDHELKDMLSKILVDNITLQKQLSSVLHYALKISDLTWKDDAKIPAENESLNMK